MKRALSALVLIMAVAVPAASQAMPMRPAPYVSGFLGVTLPRDTDVTTTNFAPGGSPDQRIGLDPGFNVGVATGFDFGYLRLEGEFSYKEADIKSITDKAGVAQFRDVDGTLSAAAFLVNAFFDIHNDTPVTPYVGGGVGVATVHITDTFATNASNQRVRMYPQDDQTVFAYQVGAGIGIALNRRYSLDVGYRYFNTDKANFSGDQLTASGIRFESHNATVGFRMTF
jgi:opacity protein-like surface antigen